MAREPEELAEQRRSLGEQLATFRRAADLTQGQLAKRAYCDRTTVTHLEKGRARADERFWYTADEAVHAGGVLLDAFHALEAAKREHALRVHGAELAAARAKAEQLRVQHASQQAAFTAPVTTAVSPEAVPEGQLPTFQQLAAAVHALIGTGETAGVLCSLLAPLIDQFERNASSSGAGADELLMILRRWVECMLQRRDLFQALGWTATGALVSSVLGQLNPDEQARVAGAVAAPRRVDAQVIGHIEESLWIANQQDARLGPQAALDMVLAQRSLIRVILPECPEPLQSRLFTVFGSASLMAGWLSFDSNNFTNAEYYYEQVRVMAHKAQDTNLAAFVLGAMSQLATWTGKSHIGIDHAVAAQTWAAKKNNPQLQAVVADRAAHAYAADGHYDECMRELDRIQVCLASPPGQPLRIPGYCDPRSQGYRYWGRGGATCKSRCMLQLGKPQEAAVAANAALVSTSSVRDTAFCALYLGKAYIQAEDIDEAAKVIGDVAELFTQNRSTRLMAELRTARTAMQPWGEVKAVRELNENLQAYGLV